MEVLGGRAFFYERGTPVMVQEIGCAKVAHRGTSLIRNIPTPEDHRRALGMGLL